MQQYLSNSNKVRMAKNGENFRVVLGVHFEVHFKIFQINNKLKSEKMFFCYLEYLREQKQQEELKQQQNCQNLIHQFHVTQEKSNHDLPIIIQENIVLADPISPKNDQKKASPFSHTQPPKNKKKPREKEIQIQDQYIPNAKEEKKKNPNNNQKNFKRNIVPNMMHQLFCFIQKKPRSSPIVSKYYSQTDPDQLSVNKKVKRFYGYQKLFRERKNNYLNTTAISYLNSYQEPEFQVYSQSEQDEYLMLNRILIKYFLESQLDLIIMTSIRMVPESRHLYLQSKRRMKEVLENFLEQ